MSKFFDKLRANRADSLQPRPPGPGAGFPKGIDGLRVREQFRNACYLPIDEITPDPVQPRQSFPPATITQMADSLRLRGQLVPISVRFDAQLGKHIIIDGERRYRGALEAKLPRLSCVVWDVSDPSTILEIQLVVNAIREDVSPMEQAQAWRRLIEEKGYTHAELAAKLGYDRSTITRTVGLTEASPAIQEAVAAGTIKPQTGYELSRIADPEEQAQLVEEAKAGKLRRDDLKGRTKRKDKPVVEPMPAERVDPLPGQQNFPAIAATGPRYEEVQPGAAYPFAVLPDEPEAEPTPAIEPTPATAARPNFGLSHLFDLNGARVTVAADFPLEANDLVRILAVALQSAERLAIESKAQDPYFAPLP